MLRTSLAPNANRSCDASALIMQRYQFIPLSNRFLHAPSLIFMHDNGENSNGSRSVARYRRRAWMASQTLDAARNHEEPEDLEKGGSHGRRSHKKEYDLTATMCTRKNGRHRATTSPSDNARANRKGELI